MSCRLLSFLSYCLFVIVVATMVLAQSTGASSDLNFAPVVTYDAGNRLTTSMALGDLNGDGKLDVVATGLCTPDDITCKGGLVSILLGNGDGSFGVTRSYHSGNDAAFQSVVLADVNRDGKLDILIANNCGYSRCVNQSAVRVLLGNGDGTFQPVVIYDSGGSTANSLAVADVNGDGNPDLVVANTGSVGILLGKGDGTFYAPVTYDSGGSGASSVAVADVNGDGKLDVVVANNIGANNFGSVGVLLGNGDGTFQPPVSYGTGGFGASSVAVADLNGDGIPDLIVANGYADIHGNTLGPVSVLMGNGNGTFKAAVPYAAGGGNNLLIADVNGDGKPDILLSNVCPTIPVNCAAGTVGVMLGNGDGSFEPPVIYGSGGSEPSSVAFADVNGDGNPDIVVLNCGPGLYGCGAYIIDPTGTIEWLHGQVGVLINKAPLLLTVQTMIKPPAAPPVVINPRANGKIPVAILSTSTFDAVHQVERTSLTFGHSGNESSLAFCAVGGKDVNGDGLLDLVCYFNTQQTGIVAGDKLAVVNGKTTAGRRFKGAEAIRTVPR